MTEIKTRMPAADLSIRLIKLFASRQRPLRLMEIVEGLETNQATTIRLLGEFEKHEWVQRLGAKGPYRLTSLPLYYAGQALSDRRLAGLAAPFIERLAKEVDCLVVLSVPDEGRVTCVACENSTHPIRVSSEIGCRYRYHCDAAGKAIVAWTSPEFVDRILSEERERYTENTITDSAELLEEFARIRRQGYALDAEEHYPGIVCIAGPVFDYRNRCIASVTIASLTFYDSTKTLATKKKDALLTVCESIGRLMGYAGPYPTDTLTENARTEDKRTEDKRTEDKQSSPEKSGRKGKEEK